jgi:hypothetical protein
LDLIDFTQRLFAIERRLDLFAQRVGGLPWWDAVRYHVFEHLYSVLAGEPGAPPVRRGLAARLAGWLRRVVLRALLHQRLRHGCEVMVFRAPRQTRAGRRVDTAIDDLLSVCSAEMFVIQTDPDYYHVRRRAPPASDPDLHQAIDVLNAALGAEFGMEFDAEALRRLIAVRFAEFRRMLIDYRRLLARARPRVILLTQNGMEKALFLAASEAGIDVVEAQHGLIGPLHPAYAYPADGSYGAREMFPAVFLAFAPYWIQSCFYPARECIALGNDHFVVEALPAPPGPGAIMFISADIYHDVLADWVDGLAARLPSRRIVYKLHPNQRNAVEAIRQQFSALPNVEVVDATITVRALLAEVTHVVLIQSTAAMEALQSGRRLCILPLRHYRVHEALFELRAVTVTPTLDELVRAVEQPPELQAPPRFFDAFDATAARRLLARYGLRA